MILKQKEIFITIMGIYVNRVIMFIISFLLMIQLVNPTHAVDLEWCLNRCRAIFGVQGPLSNWNKYLSCLHICTYG